MSPKSTKVATSLQLAVKYAAAAARKSFLVCLCSVQLDWLVVIVVIDLLKLFIEMRFCSSTLEKRNVWMLKTSEVNFELHTSSSTNHKFSKEI